MIDIVILAVVPALIALWVWWSHSLVLAILGTISIYVLFLTIGLRVPIGVAAGIWFTYALALIPFQLLRFPGQYTAARRFVHNLYAWPLIATFTAIAEQDSPPPPGPDPVTGEIDPPFDLPADIEGQVGYVHSSGLEEDCIIVFLDEFEDQAFYAAGSMQSEGDVREEARLRLTIDRRVIEELGHEVLWITAATRIDGD